MKVRAVKSFISQQFGNVQSGDVLDLGDKLGQDYVDNKLAVAVDAPVEKKADLDQTTTEKTTGSSLPAAQAAPKPTAKQPKSGARRRKAKGK